MNCPQESIFFAESPETITHLGLDLDVNECEVTISTLDCDDGSAERQVEIHDAEEPRRVFGRVAIACHRVFLFSWQLLEYGLTAIKARCLKRVGTVLPWRGRECARRAAESIRLLSSYLSLFGGCGDGAGASTSPIHFSNFQEKTRSRPGVFAGLFAQRVFSCDPHPYIRFQ